MEEQSNEALWYVVHTYSGYENKVATDLQTMVENRRLQDLICDTLFQFRLLPHIFHWKAHRLFHHQFLLPSRIPDNLYLQTGTDVPRQHWMPVYLQFLYFPLQKAFWNILHLEIQVFHLLYIFENLSHNSEFQ